MQDRFRRLVGALAGLALLAGLGLPGALTAQEGEEPLEETSRQELAEIEATMVLTRERAEELRREIADMDGDRDRQNAALIAAAQRVRLAEIEATAMEQRLDDLLDEEGEVRARLNGANSDISSLLGALQRISRSPPPAMIVRPGDALNSARGAMLLSAALPQMRSRADTVTGDLARLVELRAEAEAEETALSANYTALFEEQLRIATLIEARRQGLARAEVELDAAERAAAALEAEAESLNQLIQTVAGRISAASGALDNVTSDSPGGALSPEEVQLALADLSRSEPAFPFGRAKGFLRAPASGVTVTDFGARDGFGGISNGISIVTRADAEVLAPADGWIMFRGPYLNYGQIIIMDAGDGYSVLLAGLQSVDVEMGQFVRQGEQLGVMGSRTIGRTVTTSAGVSRPTLYIEIRDDSGAIDPTGWWSDQNRTESG